MKKCPKCGTMLEDQAAFCHECGENLGGGPQVFRAGSGSAVEDDEDEMRTIIIGGTTEEESDNPSGSVNQGGDMQPSWQKMQAPGGAEAPGFRPEGTGASGPQENAFQNAVFCPNCGHRNQSGETFCEECGSRLDGSDIASGTASEPAGMQGDSWQSSGWQEDGQTTKKGKAGKAVKIAAGVAAAAVLIAAGVKIVPGLLSSGSGGSGSGKPLTKAVWYNEDGLYYADLTKKKDQSTLVTEDLTKSGYSYRFGGNQAITKDGKYLYFGEDYDGSFDLKRIRVSDIGKKNKEAESVASNVDSYYLFDSGTVMYEKSGKVNLIPNGDLGKNDRIGSDFTTYRTSQDGTAMLWLEKTKSDKYNLNYIRFGKEKTALKEGIKGDSVILGGVDSEKLSYFYLLVKKDSGYALNRYTSDGKETEVDSKLSSSTAALYEKEAYYHKENKDDVSSVYYWNGKEAAKLEKDYSQILKYEKDGAVLIASAEESNSDEGVVHIYKGGKDIWNMKVSSDDYAAFGDDFCYDSKQKRYLVTAREEGDDRNSLYEIKEGTSKMKKIAGDVKSLTRTSDDRIYYVADIDRDGIGDLYENDKKIASGVYRFTTPKNVSAVFTLDEDSDMNVIRNGKAEKVQSDVENYAVGNDKSVLILYDYSKGEGTLGYYDGKNITVISNEASAFSR